MIKASILAAATIAALTASGANAAMTSGIVKSVDSSHDAIRLADGSVYTLAEGSEAEDFKPGTKVAITFAKKHGENVASSVKVMK